jgi:hypothetical protein
MHSVSTTKSLFGNPDSSLLSATQSITKTLNKRFPLQKYAVTGDSATRTPQMPGTVIIREGFPKSASITASYLPYKDEDGELVTERGDLPDYQKYMIIATLPFHARACMFWNMASVLDAGGVSEKEMLKGEELKNFRTDTTVSTTEITRINEKVLLLAAQQLVC